MAAHVNFKTVIVVDGDVDIYDPADVMWALGDPRALARGPDPDSGRARQRAGPDRPTRTACVCKGDHRRDAARAERRERYVKVVYPPVDLERYLRPD